MRDLEQDLTDYILGLWAMHRIARMVRDKGVNK